MPLCFLCLAHTLNHKNKKMNTSAVDNNLYDLYTSIKAADTLDKVSALLLAANESALLGANEYAFFQEMIKRYAAVGSLGRAGDFPFGANEAIATTIFAHYRLGRSLAMCTNANKKELLA